MPNLDYIPKYTFSDYKLWKGDWELIKGHPISMSPSANMQHQIIANEINTYFFTSLKKNKENCSCNVVYELDWKVNNETILRPDISIICTDKISTFIETVPILIVEILSPSTHLKDRNTKFAIYEQNGVKFYIMVNPESSTIEIFQLIDNKYKEVYITEFDLKKNCKLSVDLQNIF